MGAIVSYKGSTIATFSNEVKTLTTAGTWVEDDIKITAIDEVPNVTQDQEGYVVLDDDGTLQTIVNSLSVSANGIYTASSGYAFNPVIVNVSGAGGISVDDIAMRTISGNIYGEANAIKSYAFFGCHDLTSVNFPNATSIGVSAFMWCSNLTSISFPNVITINSNAFMSCVNLTTVSFPNATTIGSQCFYNCSSLASVNIPNASTIKTYAFGYCIALTSVSFPNVTSINNSTFYSCSSLVSVNIPNATIIGDTAFGHCSNLISISFPNIISIGSNAFYSCKSLATAIFNHTSTSQGVIYGYAFRSCCNLISLYLLASNLYKLSISSTTFISTPIDGYTTSTGGVYGSIFVPASLYDSYISSTNWSYFSERFVSLTESQVSYVMEHGTHVMS